MQKQLFFFTTFFVIATIHCSTPQASAGALNLPPLIIPSSPAAQPLPAQVPTNAQPTNLLLPQIPNRQKRRSRRNSSVSQENVKSDAELIDTPCELDNEHNIELLRKTAQAARGEQTVFHNQKLIALSALERRLDRLEKLFATISAQNRMTNSHLADLVKLFGAVYQRPPVVYYASYPAAAQYPAQTAGHNASAAGVTQIHNPTPYAAYAYIAPQQVAHAHATAPMPSHATATHTQPMYATQPTQ